jgi:orotate phosphoribosyltransferase
MENEKLAEILLERSYHERAPDEPPFILASGKQSWHYFECQRTTSYAAALPVLGQAFFERLLPSVTCVGGLTRGADPIADCIAYYSAAQGGRPVNTFSVRKQLKDHGTMKWIEGSAGEGERVAIVDDVVTSGGSVMQAIERARAEGLQILQVIVLVDREEGGLDNIRAVVGAGVPVEALFRYSELRAHYRTLQDRQPAAGRH